MPASTTPPARPRVAGAGGFTLTGMITGLAATAAAVVLGVLVTARVAQHGVRDAEAAIAGLQSSLAGSLAGAQVSTNVEASPDPEPASDAPGTLCYGAPPPPPPAVEFLAWNPPCITPVCAWHCRLWARRPRHRFPGRLVPPRRR